MSSSSSNYDSDNSSASEVSPASASSNTSNSGGNSNSSSSRAPVKVGKGKGKASKKGSKASGNKSSKKTSKKSGGKEGKSKKSKGVNSDSSRDDAVYEAELEEFALNTDATKKPMTRLMAYLWPFRVHLSLSIAASVLNKVLDLAPPLLVGWLIDSISGDPPHWIFVISLEEGSYGKAPHAGVWNIPAVLGVLTVLIFAFESLFQFLYQYGFQTLSHNVQHELRLTCYRVLQERELAFFHANRTGALINLVKDDINQVERFLGDGFNELVQLATLFVFSCVVLFSTSWELTLIGCIPIPVLIIGSFWFQNTVTPKYAAVRTAASALTARLENNIGGIAVVKAFTAEEYEADRVAAASAQYKYTSHDAIYLAAYYVPVIRMAIAVGFAAVVVFGGYWVINEERDLTVGQLVLFSMLIQRALWPLTRLGKTLDDFQRARAASARVFTLLDTQPRLVNPENPRSFKKKWTVEFDNVHFSYPGTPKILRGLNMKIDEGEAIGVVGTTGAGKSTLVKLILRLYDVNISGSVSVAGRDVREVDMTALRQSVALVSQDIYIFSGSIMENICYGQSDVDEALRERAVEASRKAQLHEYVSSLPEGYDTLVGERGVKMSGGQRQRLSLARAILKDSPILILDEATSAVDTETERAIQQSISKLSKDKTAIVIAHRLSTIRQSDRILVLKDGVVAEEGNHEELIELGGVYADLWAVQTGET